MLEGELVRLRPLVEDDFEALRRIAADPLLWEQHPNKERATPEGFRRWMDDALASGGALTTLDREGTVIGSSRYVPYAPIDGAIEIGWTFIARSLWGQGHNADMKRLMLDHAFRFVPTVVLLVHRDNLRSQRAVEKLGADRIGSAPPETGRPEHIVFRLERP